MIRIAPLITADVDNATLPGGKASDAAQDFLALLSEALTGEATTDKAAPQLLVATDKPTAKGEPLVSDIVSDAQQADLLIPVDETPPVINDEQSTSTPLTTAQTMALQRTPMMRNSSTTVRWRNCPQKYTTFYRL